MPRLPGQERAGLRPGPGPGTEHDQHDRYQDEHDAADEQADTDGNECGMSGPSPPAKATGAAASVFITTTR